MQVFHFLNASYGLDDIRRRRLKVATLNELNDPFELFGVNLRDEALRRALTELKDRAAKKMGLLCFSRDWHNPVLWSHYAERHTGMCLGFDVPDEHIYSINYSRRRVVIGAEDLKPPRRDIDLMKCLFTKYTHWRYEDEVRVFVNLEETQREGALHFIDFGAVVRLNTVIVGAQSQLTRQSLRAVLGDFGATVKIFKARLAFRTFRVVRQRRDDLWR
jgi:hypothetical protein